MRVRSVLVVAVLVILAFSVGRLSAAVGTLDSPGGPDSDAAKMYTLEDIYNRLDTGAAGVQNTFTEPAAGPGTATMHDLNEIMAQAPALDNTNGATETNVLDGKTFWGLTAGQWGTQTGTMPNNGAVTIVPTRTNQTIAQGYHNGSGEVLGETNLVSGNIKSGVSIYGVDGDPMVVNTSSGDAAAGDIKDGKKAWVDGAQVTGNIPTQTVSNTIVSQLAGYYDAFNLSLVDTDLVSPNIRSGVNLFGVDGDPMVMNTSSGTATASDILSGTVAYVDGLEVTGTMTNNVAVTVVPTTTNQTIAQGYHNGLGKVEGDADLVADKIKQGVDIFGVTGSYAGTACTGDATTTDVLYPKTFSNSSATGLTGELHGGCTCCITCTLRASRWCDNGDGTVTDLTTCLVWLKDADWGDNGDWGGAHTRAGKLNAGTSDAGLSDGSVLGDWRLPTRNEFDHLLNGSPNIRCTTANDDCNVYGFTGIAGRWATVGGAEGNYGYWTSTTMAGDNSGAYYIEPATGAVRNEAKSWWYGLVWPVRGGQ
jgi:hypothetical protein